LSGSRTKLAKSDRLRAVTGDEPDADVDVAGAAGDLLRDEGAVFEVGNITAAAAATGTRV
jgi:hypothetical protein